MFSKITFYKLILQTYLNTPLPNFDHHDVRGHATRNITLCHNGISPEEYLHTTDGGAIYLTYQPSHILKEGPIWNMGCVPYYSRIGDTRIIITSVPPAHG
jgi:hypothetical protein